MSEPLASRLITDTVMGAIVGGMIGVSGTIAVLVFEYKKWKKGLRVEHLRHQREKIEALFSRIYNGIGASFEKRAEADSQEFPIDTQGDIAFLCPPEVRERIQESMELDPEKEPIDAARDALATISIHMKSYLAKIDGQIEEELGVGRQTKNRRLG